MILRESWHTYASIQVCCQIAAANQPTYIFGGNIHITITSTAKLGLGGTEVQSCSTLLNANKLWHVGVNADALVTKPLHNTQSPNLRR
jgi:hypothetical protein